MRSGVFRHATFAPNPRRILKAVRRYRLGGRIPSKTTLMRRLLGLRDLFGSHPLGDLGHLLARVQISLRGSQRE